jgi:hypothetical protein
MTRKLSETLSPEELAERKKDNHFFRTLGTFIRYMSEDINFSVMGPLDYPCLDGIYILLYNPVLKECAFPKARFEGTPAPIPEDFRIRLVAFLDDCATNKAAFYRRDWKGYVWEIIDQDAYVECCKRHGFSPTDYQVSWLKSQYDESGQPIKGKS